MTTNKPIGRCYACNGSKKLMGMGMMVKDCYVCNGVGHIVVPDNDKLCPPVHALVTKDEAIVRPIEPIEAANVEPMVKPTPKPKKRYTTANVVHIDKRSKAYRDRNKSSGLES